MNISSAITLLSINLSYGALKKDRDRQTCRETLTG